MGGDPLRELQDDKAEVEYAPFARLLAEGAYARGARYVDIWYFDPYAKLSRLRHAESSTLAEVPTWIDRRHPDLAAAGGVLINLRGQLAPDLLAGIGPVRAGLDRMPALESRIGVQVQQLVPWTIALHPSKAWATMVYGAPDVDRLWGEMRRFLRLDAPDPQQAWRQRLSELRGRAEQLNDLELDAVHFHGPGTDLTIGFDPASSLGHCRAPVCRRPHVPGSPADQSHQPDARPWPRGVPRTGAILAVAGCLTRLAAQIVIGSSERRTAATCP